MLAFAVTVIRFAAYSAWIEIRDSFGRTYLGILWNTLSLFSAAAVLGLFFGTILKTEVGGYETYIPFLAAGLFVWVFLSSSINQSCSVFSSRAHTLRHTSQPFVSFALIALFRNLVIFIQTTTIAVFVYWLLVSEFPVALIPFILGVLVVAANVLWLSLLAAVACVRFRDLPQLLSAIINIGFFLTPIIWREHVLGRYVFLADLNPAHHLVSLVRLPLLGVAPSPESWSIAIGMLVIGGSLTALLYAKTRNRIPYWL